MMGTELHTKFISIFLLEKSNFRLQELEYETKKESIWCSISQALAIPMLQKDYPGISI